MSTLFAVDPGKWKYGWALLHNEVIVDAGWSDFDVLPEAIHNLSGKHLDRVVFEWPQVYPGPRNEDPNDLLDLAFTLGMVEKELRVQEFYGKVERFHPREWKKQVPKNIHNRRALNRMTPEEKKIVGSNHNVIDAAALGIWACGRW